MKGIKPVINETKMIRFCAAALLVFMVTSGCGKEKIKDNTITITDGDGSTAITVNISTDKAFYHPGDAVRFTIDKSLPSTAKVRYKQAGAVIKDVPITGTGWIWTTPSTDFTGYMAEIYDVGKGEEKIYGCIAVDVSSDPARFPRNGFLSAYGQLSTAQIGSVMASLNRYHMNYVQFQDWDYEHHLPLAGTVANPDAMWKDIANRDNYFSTVKGYVDAAHSYNMKTLSYNLAYGALSDAASAGVKDEWYMYDDANHQIKEVFQLPKPPFKSDIYFTDPSNTGWQQYIAAKTNDIYTVFGFDGYQVDQVGNRNKTLYNYSGGVIDLPATFGSFIRAIKTITPDKALVMNAVTQYGQQYIAAAPVDFLYSEVWAPNDDYSDLGAIIQSNDALTGNVKKSVLAAYMDYNIAEKPGYFSTPGVLLTDAVIFAFGGSHLELGDHMLGKEYFPNANLVMPDDLKAAMITYYDFLTAYQNLLRDGGKINSPVITSADNQVKLNSWPPQAGQVSVIGRDLGNKQVISLVNFNNANSLKWRDADGTQPAPKAITALAFAFSPVKAVKKIWMASPDIDGGASKEINFTANGNLVTFILPSLKYWDMVVVEYQ